MHLHDFDTPVDGAPHSRQCGACGERQHYSPPTGRGVAFTDVLVDEADLRHVLSYAPVGPSANEAVTRVRRLLDSA